MAAPTADRHAGPATRHEDRIARQTAAVVLVLFFIGLAVYRRCTGASGSARAGGERR